MEQNQQNMSKLPKLESIGRKTISKLQEKTLELMQTAATSHFDINSHFTLDDEEGTLFLPFDEEDKEFSPVGYDERDLVIGIAIDTAIKDKLMIQTKDSEDVVNLLSIEQAPMKRADWAYIYETVHALLGKQMNAYA